MKKRILLFVAMVTIFALVFALSASADELQNDKGIYYSTSNEFGTVNILDVMTPVTSQVKTDAENYTTTYFEKHSLEQRVVLANGDGTFSTYPSAYIMNLNNSEWKLMGINPAKINAHTGYEYTMESIIRFEIPEGITRIGHDERDAINIHTATNCVYLSIPASFSTSSGTQKGSAFKGMTNLVTIDMSKCTSLTKIENNWFRDCTSLTTILWPQSGLTAIHNGAFVNCTSLTTLVIPEGVNFPVHTQNDYGAFGACTSLTSVTLPSSVTNIHKRAFDGCTSLATVNLPEGLTAVQDQAFRNTAVTTVSFPSTLETVGNYMFQNCKQLTSVQFNGANLDKIGTAAFENCTSLGSIVLPEGLVTLGNCAFKGCSSLTSVTLPTTLTTLEDQQHFYNTAITEVIGLENTQLTKISNAMFRGLKNWTPDVIRIPNTVTSIESYAFADVGVKKVIVGSSVTEIKNEAFTGCKSMTEFVLPSGLTTINFNNSTARLFFVTSTDTTYLNTVNSKVSGTIISYADYSENPEKYASGKYVISGYSACVAFYGSVHLEDTNPCLIECTRCGLSEQDPNANHDFATVIEYANGFATAGKATKTCQNEGCACNTTPEVADVKAIFEGFKYATREEDSSKYGLVLSYIVNKEALTAYETAMNTTLTYGVLAIAEQNVSGNPLENDGTPNVESIVATDVTGVPAVDLIIWGKADDWDTVIDEETGKTVKDISFYILGYVIEGDTLNYFYDEASSENLTDLSTKSYNGAKA